MTFKLLTVGNPKTEKGAKLGYLTGILHLSPSDVSGYNVCPFAVQMMIGEVNSNKSQCSLSCLNLAGRGGIAAGGLITAEGLRGGRRNMVQNARIRRTKMFFEQRGEFFAALVKDIVKLVKLATKNELIACVRLNGTSDLDWTAYRIEGKTIFDMFPNVQFYDYTKVPNRGLKTKPANYHVTYSLNDSKKSDGYAAANLAVGVNVAVVFNTKKNGMLPKMYMDVPVVDGDDTDLRFLDPRTVIVGLRAKGLAKKDTTGFVRSA